MRTVLAVVVIAAVVALAWWAFDVNVTDTGEMPRVDVEGGRAPEVAVETPDVDVGTQEKTVTVPDVDVQPADEAPRQPQTD